MRLRYFKTLLYTGWAFSKWDELSLGTNCRLGLIAAFRNLGRTLAWDELSLYGVHLLPVSIAGYEVNKVGHRECINKK